MNYQINRVAYKRLIYILFYFLLLLFIPALTNAQGWDKLEDSSIPRVEALSALYNNKIYVFSGFSEFSDDILKITSKCEEFDPMANSNTSLWKEIKPIPIPVTHTSTAIVGETIWVPGGFEGNDPGKSIKKVQVYNIRTNSWSEGPELPEPIASHAVVKLGNKLHVFGGLKPDRQTDSEAHYVLDLDNQARGWIKAANLPFPRNHLSGAATGGKIYAIGGQFGHDKAWSDQRYLHEYDPITDKWTRKADLPQDRSHFEPGTITRNGKIIIVGGRNRANAVILDKITEYNPKLNKWQELNPLPKRLLAPVAKIIENKLYVTHGGDTYKDPYKTAYVRPHHEDDNDLFGTWPKAISISFGTNKTATKKFILWTYNKNANYQIEKSTLPEWIKLKESDITGITGPEGKYIEVGIDATALQPGSYDYNINASSPGYENVSLPVSIVVSDPNTIRINAGGKAITVGETVFSADAYFTTSKSYTNSKVTNIEGTENDALYLQERSSINGTTSFAYNIPVKNGNYKVRLHFAEIYWGATGGGTGGSGKRIFDVNIEGGPTEIKNFDIIEEAGSMAAIIKEFNVKVVDEELDIDFVSSVDQPKISALEIIPLYENLNALEVAKESLSSTIEKGLEDIVKNTITTSDNSVQNVYLTASSPEGKVVDWLKIDGKEINEIPVASGTEFDITVETNSLAPGNYEANLRVTAVNFLPTEFKVLLEVTTSSEPGNPLANINSTDIYFSSIINETNNKTITVKNDGAATLLISSIKTKTEEGVENPFFSTQTTLEVPPYSSQDFEVSLLSSKTGVYHGKIIFEGNDPNNPIIEAFLHGIVAKGLEGNSEPPLYQVVDALNLKTDVGFYTLGSNTTEFPIGEEVLVSNFKKVGPGKITLKPVARYSPLETLKFGYYTLSNDDATHNEVGILSEESPQHQALFPEVTSGGIEFDPQDKLFGIYTQSPLHSLYTESSLNANIETSVNHAVRIYPVKDKNGVVLENQYLIGFEEASNGDYQDYVFILSNAMPVNCEADFQLNIKELINPDCEVNYGSVEIEYTGTNAQVEFSIDEGREYQTSPVFEGLEPGDYIIYGREVESKDCISIVEFSILSSENAIDFQLLLNPVTCAGISDGFVEVKDIAGGNEPYQIEWAFTKSNESLQENLYPGTYSVTIKDSQGCSRTKDFEMVREEGCSTYTYYREVFGNNSDAENSITESGWEAYKGSSGHMIPDSPSEHDKAAISPFEGLANNQISINAGPTLDTAKGFFTASVDEGLPILVYNEEFKLNLDGLNIHTVSWQQGHSTSKFRSHVVVRILGQWYASKKDFINYHEVPVDPQFSTFAEKQNFSFTLSGNEWYFLDFIPGEVLQLGPLVSEEVTFRTLPVDEVDAFGLLIFADEPGSIRFDTYEILVEGYPLPETSVIDLDVLLTQEKLAVVTWKTTAEKDNMRFTLERSDDNNTYSEITSTNGAGNSNSIIEYELIDSLPINGLSYYRLRYTDINEAHYYTDYITLNNNSEVEPKINIYPNPNSGGYLKIDIVGLFGNDDVNIQIVGLDGRVLYNNFFKSDELGRFKNELILGKKLNPGVYAIVGKSGDFHFSKKIIIL